MAKLDNEEQQIHTLTPTPESFDFDVDPAMEDHDMLLHHVVEHDHELYAIDSALTEMLGV